MSDFQPSLEDMIDNMTPETHASLKQAVELGRWQDGVRLSIEQVELCLQAVIAYDERNLLVEDRVAYIDNSKLKKTLCND